MKKEIHKITLSVFFASAFLLLLWQIKLIESLLGWDFASFGILPRELSGFKGVLAAPIIHANMNHLVSNSFSMCFLLACMIYIYQKIALKAFIGIYLVSGVLVWLTARPVYHIGSSGLIYGLVSFLFFSGVFRLDVRLLTLSLLMVFMYGGLIWGVFPSDAGISWETHLMGSMSGIFYAYYYRTEEVLPQLHAEFLGHDSVQLDFVKYNIDQIKEVSIKSSLLNTTENSMEESKIIPLYNSHSESNQDSKPEDRKAA